MRVIGASNARRPIARLGWFLLRILKWGMYAVWGLAGACILFYAATFGYVFLVGLPAPDRVLGDASAVNDRGDVVTAETARDDTAPGTAKTVIQLRPAYRWFPATPATLLVALSRNSLVGFTWRDDDNLVLQLDFGCHPRLTTPVKRVGPIHIVYRFGNPGYAPPHGYDSFPQDKPRKPCR